ncbi:hypothetical protein O181_017830 [Austropuccinia psidii MF-1]|uniref:F-box domain-containing protein n=1 Tax=Austropuccinia psidii MF-1 TaxID=1389203 RepID=A0A9Q3C7I2_9BASI|nr:hypothetical protein [Austropuccinia psidii MF-1]
MQALSEQAIIAYQNTSVTWAPTHHFANQHRHQNTPACNATRCSSWNLASDSRQFGRRILTQGSSIFTQRMSSTNFSQFQLSAGAGAEFYEMLKEVRLKKIFPFATHSQNSRSLPTRDCSLPDSFSPCSSFLSSMASIKAAQCAPSETKPKRASTGLLAFAIQNRSSSCLFTSPAADGDIPLNELSPHQHLRLSQATQFSELKCIPDNPTHPLVINENLLTKVMFGNTEAHTIREIGSNAGPIPNVNITNSQVSSTSATSPAILTPSVIELIPRYRLSHKLRRKPLGPFLTKALPPLPTETRPHNFIANQENISLSTHRTKVHFSDSVQGPKGSGSVELSNQKGKQFSYSNQTPGSVESSSAFSASCCSASKIESYADTSSTYDKHSSDNSLRAIRLHNSMEPEAGTFSQKHYRVRNSLEFRKKRSATESMQKRSLSLCNPNSSLEKFPQTHFKSHSGSSILLGVGNVPLNQELEEIRKALSARQSNSQPETSAKTNPCDPTDKNFLPETVNSSENTSQTTQGATLPRVNLKTTKTGYSNCPNRQKREQKNTNSISLEFIKKGLVSQNSLQDDQRSLSQNMPCALTNSDLSISINQDLQLNLGASPKKLKVLHNVCEVQPTFKGHKKTRSSSTTQETIKASLRASLELEAHFKETTRKCKHFSMMRTFGEQDTRIDAAKTVQHFLGDSNTKALRQSCESRPYSPLNVFWGVSSPASTSPPLQPKRSLSPSSKASESPSNFDLPESDFLTNITHSYIKLGQSASGDSEKENKTLGCTQSKLDIEEAVPLAQKILLADRRHSKEFSKESLTGVLRKLSSSSSEAPSTTTQLEFSPSTDVELCLRDLQGDSKQRSFTTPSSGTNASSWCLNSTDTPRRLSILDMPTRSVYEIPSSKDEADNCVSEPQPNFISETEKVSLSYLAEEGLSKRDQEHLEGKEKMSHNQISSILSVPSLTSRKRTQERKNTKTSVFSGSNTQTNFTHKNNSLENKPWNELYTKSVKEKRMPFEGSPHDSKESQWSKNISNLEGSKLSFRQRRSQSYNKLQINRNLLMDSPKNLFEHCLLEFPRTVLCRILNELNYLDFLVLMKISQKLRLGLSDGDAKEVILKRFLGAVGYRPSIPILDTEGKDLNLKTQGESSTMPHELALKERLMKNRLLPKTLDSTNSKTLQNSVLISITLSDLQKFYTRLEYEESELFELATQAKLGLLASPTIKILRESMRAFNKLLMRMRSQPDEQRNYFPAVVSCKNYLRKPLRTLYVRGKPAILQVWVPTVNQSLSVEELMECEREIWRSGIHYYLKRGDVCWNVAMGNVANQGRLIYDGKRLKQLEFLWDPIGHLPHWLNMFTLPPSFYHHIITASKTAPVFYLDMTDFKDEAMKNLNICNDQVSESFHDSQSRFLGLRARRSVYRSCVDIKPGSKTGMLKRVAEFDFPYQDEGLVHPKWFGKLIIEIEGTEDETRRLLEMCTEPKLKDFVVTELAPGTTHHSNKRQHQQIAQNMRCAQLSPWRILRERSSLGEIWIQPLFHS